MTAPNAKIDRSAELKALLFRYCNEERTRSVKLENADSTEELDAVLADMRSALDAFRSEYSRITHGINSRRNCMLLSCDDAFRLAKATGITFEADDTLVVRFNQPGTFNAMHAAEQWCREHGVSYGPSDRSGTQGLLVSDFAIAKWRNLTPKERAECHGTIPATAAKGREGPLVLRISRAALDGAKP